MQFPVEGTVLHVRQPQPFEGREDVLLVDDWNVNYSKGGRDLSRTSLLREICQGRRLSLHLLPQVVD